MDNDMKLNKEDLDMVSGGENRPPKGAPAAKYNIGDRVIYWYNDDQRTGTIRDRNYYDNRWQYNIDDTCKYESGIIGLA